MSQANVEAILVGLVIGLIPITLIFLVIGLCWLGTFALMGLEELRDKIMRRP